MVGTPDGERNSCGELANASLAIGREEADHVACARGGVLDIEFGMTKKLEPYLFQVRPIVSNPNWKLISNCNSQCENFIELTTMSF